MAKVNCIDVSSYQKNVDYKKVKAAGITTVIIRAGYGREVSQKDSEFETHYKNAKSAGLKIGAYWYSYANSTSDAKNEAKACLECVKGKKFDLPIYYDMEEPSQLSYGKTALTNMAAAFCDAIKAGGYKAGVYSNLNWFKNYLDYSKLSAKYSIWLAQYYTTNDLDCDIWQNSSTGKISGVSGNVDTDIIYNNKIIGSSNGSNTSKPASTIKYSAAVKTWQHAMNIGFDFTGDRLVEDGLFGSASQAFAKKHVIYRGIEGCPTAVKWVQKSVGVTQDGIFGANTDTAVKTFQKKKRLTADGEVGLNTTKAILGIK